MDTPPIVKARDAFLNSEEATTLCNPSTLGKLPESAFYLRNRIEAAFLKGWDAATYQSNREQLQQNSAEPKKVRAGRFVRIGGVNISKQWLKRNMRPNPETGIPASDTTP